MNFTAINWRCEGSRCPRGRRHRHSRRRHSYKPVVLQIGQGGNQYGFAFFNAIANPSTGFPPEFFEEKQRKNEVTHTARALLVDTEPKVVASVTKKANATGLWRYPPQKFTLDSGSGNNWAAGYCNNAPSLNEPLLDQIHLKVEECDYFGGFMGILSLAGGTGAGFGSHLLEILKDEYPSASIFGHCIWPYETGEVVVQSYNVLLTLAKLQEIADGIITVQNEALAAICKRSLGIQRPSFAEMNSVAAHSLASVLLPSSWRHIRCPTRHSQEYSSRQYSQEPDVHVRLFSDLSYTLCADPGYRILGLYSTPKVRKECVDFTSVTWGSQLKHLKRMVYPIHYEEQLYSQKTLQKFVQKSIASLLVLRGKGSQTADVNMFMEPSLYSSRCCVDPLSVAYHVSQGTSDKLDAAMLTNCQAAVKPAIKALSRAYSMYFSRAYLHQYFQHGLDSPFFEAAFATVEDVLSRYKSL